MDTKLINGYEILLNLGLRFLLNETKPKLSNEAVTCSFKKSLETKRINDYE